jgi:hypothetical protein
MCSLWVKCAETNCLCFRWQQIYVAEERIDRQKKGASRRFLFELKKLL